MNELKAYYLIGFILLAYPIAMAVAYMIGGY